MVKGGGAKIIKCLLFTATFLICLGGIAVFAVGIWAALQQVKSVESLVGSEMYTVASYVFIATGAGVACISSLGCCGAMKENRFKLGLYFIVLFVIFVILLAGGIMGWLFKDQMEDKLLKSMQKSVALYGKKEYATSAWNAMQQQFQCCGFAYNTTKESYQIWEDNEYVKNRSMIVAPSCCKDLNEPVECQNDVKNKIFLDDCYVVIKDYFKQNSKIIGGIGIGIALFLTVGMVLTCCLYRSLK